MVTQRATPTITEGGRSGCADCDDLYDWPEDDEDDWPDIDDDE